MVQVQIAPQRAIAAPGGTLLEQVIYPAALPQSAHQVDMQRVHGALQQVGLSELLERSHGDWMLSQDWQGTAVVAVCSLAAI